MLRVNNQIEIKISRPELFDFMACFENLPKWNYYVLNVKKTSSGDNGIGTRYHQIRKNDEQEFQVTEYTPSELLSLETVNHSKPGFRRTFKLSENGSKTRLEDDFEIETDSPLILEKILKRRIQGAVYENLGKLKELLETGKTTLQDGRLILLD